MNNNTVKYNTISFDLPENWGMQRLKNLCSEKNTYGVNIPNSKYEESGVRFLRTTDIDENGNIGDGGIFIAKKNVPDGYFLNKGDVLFSRSGTIGRCYFHNNDDEYTYAGFLVKFKPKNIDISKWLYYFSFSKYFKYQLSTEAIESTIFNFNGNKYSVLKVAVPNDIETVRKINNFLDKKCEQINQFIADKKKLINLLKEQRQSIVSNYVNSGCVENLSLKENPTIWLKESRSDWQFIKLKHLVELNKSSIDNAKKKNDLQKIALENIDNWTGKFLDGKKDAFEGQGVEFNKGDVLFNKLRPYLAKAIIAQNDGYCVGELLVLKPLQELITSEFLFFRLMTVEIIDYVNGSTYGAKMPRANWDFIGNIKIPLPSIDEQNIIVSKIKEETKTIDETIFKTEEELRLVAEYKEALISNAVTGQLHIA